MNIKKIFAATLSLALTILQPLPSVSAVSASSGVPDNISGITDDRKAIGAISWQGSTEYVAPGSTATVTFTVHDSSKKSLSISSAEFTLTPKEGKDINENPLPPLEIESVSGSPAYNAELKHDPDTNIYSFQTPDGADIPSVDGEVVLTAKLNIPESCPIGSYPVNLRMKSATGEGGKKVLFYVFGSDAVVNVMKDPPQISSDSIYGELPGSVGYYDRFSHKNFSKDQLRFIKIAKEGRFFSYDQIKDQLVLMNNKNQSDPTIESIYDGREGGKYENLLKAGYISSTGSIFPIKDLEYKNLYVTAYIYDNILGDINCDNIVTGSDSSMILKEYSRKLAGEATQLSDEQLYLADVSTYPNNTAILPEERVIDAIDANIILRYYSYISSGGSYDLPTFINEQINEYVYTPDKPFKAEEIEASALKPEISLNTRYDKANKKIIAEISVSGADKKYSSYSLALKYDPRLIPAEDGVSLGNAVYTAQNAFHISTNNNIISLAGTSTSDDCQDGIIAAMEFSLPDDFKDSDMYTFSLLNNCGEVFINNNNDRDGQLMQAYAFSQFPKTVEITPSSDPDYGDANVNGKIEIGDAVLIMQAVANPDKYGVGGSSPEALTYEGKNNADCYQPGSDITSMDALAVQKRLAGIAVLPILE